VAVSEALLGNGTTARDRAGAALERLSASQRVSGTGSEAAPEANEGYAMATRRREALATP